MDNVTKSNYSICLFNVYFGDEPQLFELWLNSAKKNNSIIFYFFSDNKKMIDQCNETDNVKGVFLNKNSFLSLCKEKFGFIPSLDKPYKLCDYKVAYGDIFSDYARGFDFWGFYDIDLIFGQIRNFINDEILKNETVISIWGHLSIIKNEPKMVKLYKESVVGSKISFPNVYKNSFIWITDEGVRREILKQEGISFYDTSDLICDMDYNSYLFRNVYNKQITNAFIAVYENGVLNAIYKNGDSIISKEILYIHLQKRKMEIKACDLNNTIVIFPNKIVNTTLKSNEQIFDAFFSKKQHIMYCIKKKFIAFKKRVVDHFKRKKLLKTFN